MKRSQIGWCPVLLVVLATGALAPRLCAAAGGQLELKVIDHDTGAPIACRMHLKNRLGRPQKTAKTSFFHDHFLFSGNIVLKLPKGDYSFEVECGPEYLTQKGRFTIYDFAQDSKTIEMKRFANMAKEGWWSGDLDVRRPAHQIELAMQADDLHLAEVITSSNQGAASGGSARPANSVVQFDGSRYYDLLAGADIRADGAVHIFRLHEPLDLSGAAARHASMLETIEGAKANKDAWIDVARAESWDLPVWLAKGHVDSIELADSRIARSSVDVQDDAGRPRDKLLYPGPSGPGRWAERIYYHVLNCGLRIPPSAGSGSGVAPNPVGYNRVYVYTGGQFSYERFWEALRAGRVTVTNGPLLRPTVDGERPGYVFEGPAGQEMELEIGLTLSTRDKISYVELVRDGVVVYSARLDEWHRTGGKLPPLKFNQSGWFLVRAVTDLTETYRFAMTAPYYVEIGGQPRISRASAKFFVEWIAERAAGLKLDDAAQQKQAMEQIDVARNFWQGLLARANAE